MRMKNLYRKPITTAGSRYCSISVLIIWTLLILVSIFLLHLYSSFNMIQPQPLASFHFHQLQQIENHNFQIPPPNKKSLPQIKSITPLVDEFLDQDSSLREVFFPMETIRKRNDSYNNYYFPGRIWLDTDGNPIQAHGGCVLFDESSTTYYWYGEYKDGPTYLANHNKGPARVSHLTLCKQLMTRQLLFTGRASKQTCPPRLGLSRKSLKKILRCGIDIVEGMSPRLGLSRKSLKKIMRCGIDIVEGAGLKPCPSLEK
ncbi:hypothetical protein KIW84_042512 [Lathyrus oleraceus]|uniref:Uncharacterized protein n=1 Tax=Pisum sativum TaxID=3888 RepID=A0A9D5AT54_PEA|nr:hypothetical protein KIW84_042512 [Pisum sativum]